jgi:hypothetical protein
MYGQDPHFAAVLLVGFLAFLLVAAIIEGGSK